MPLPLEPFLDSYRPSRRFWQICTAGGVLILSGACEAQRFAAVDDATTADDAATVTNERTELVGTALTSHEEAGDSAWTMDSSHSFTRDAATEYESSASNFSSADADAGSASSNVSQHTVDAGLPTTDRTMSAREAGSGVATSGLGVSGDLVNTSAHSSTAEWTDGDGAQPSDTVETHTTDEARSESSTEQGETLDNWPPDLDDLQLDAGFDAASDASALADASDASAGDAASKTSSTDGEEAGIIVHDAEVQPQDASLDAHAASDSASSVGLICTPTMTLPGVVRDFSNTHPDMEPCEQQGVDCSSERGLVEPVLGKDGKPVLSDAPRREESTVSDNTNFSQWYRDVEGVNTRIAFDLELRQWRTRLIYSSDDPPASSPAGFYGDPPGFFPIDDALDGGDAHNYHFTYEVRSYVEYTGGESLRVRGDDDIWVFIDRKLVVDLGGIHLTEEATVELDDVAESLGLVPGRIYEFHLFFAERHKEQSNLRLGTSMRFMDCSQGQSL